MNTMRIVTDAVRFYAEWQERITNFSINDV
jgi:hypothetical protein